jgi:hypothetical protein
MLDVRYWHFCDMPTDPPDVRSSGYPEATFRDRECRRKPSIFAAAMFAWRPPIVSEGCPDDAIGFILRKRHLRRLARKRNLDNRARQNNPTGKSLKPCPALRRKIFGFRRRANQRYQLARLTR